METAVSDKRQAILNATLNLIAEYGFHNTPMSKVAKEAGVSAGIIYHYFANKEALLTELYSSLKLDMSKALVANHSDDLPIEEQFRNFWFNMVHYGIQHPKEVMVVEQCAQLPEFTSVTNEVNYQLFTPILEFGERAKAEGILKDLPVEVLYSLTLEVAVSLAQKHVAGLIELDDATMKAASDACWDAVKR